MSSPLSANAVLDRVYLEVRCKLLDIAACLYRVALAEEERAQEDRADDPNSAESDARLVQIAKGIEILYSPGLDRAERIQTLFSDPYVPNWNRRDGRATDGARPHN